jgi:hypothetical protein
MPEHSAKVDEISSSVGPTESNDVPEQIMGVFRVSPLSE